MNIYEFFSSRDIAEHCKRINHSFSALEQACIIWQSETHTIAQKHAAWQEIIDTLPDEALPDGKWPEEDSLHPFLEHYIQKEREFLSLFPSPAEDAVFSYEVHLIGNDCYTQNDNLYCDYLSCAKAAAEAAKDGASGIRIKKRRICKDATHDSDSKILRLNLNLEPIAIDRHGEADRQLWRLTDAFLGFGVSIPTLVGHGDFAELP